MLPKGHTVRAPAALLFTGNSGDCTVTLPSTVAWRATQASATVCWAEQQGHRASYPPRNEPSYLG
jgi:hypothetical protein